MANSLGRRAAIIDEIERRLSQIKICNGYPLDIAIVQKRFPHLNDLLQLIDPLDQRDDTSSINLENIDFLGEATLPCLLLQYGSLGGTTDRSEVTGRGRHLEEQSGNRARFANINQLEEALPIVIRGIVRENDSKEIQNKIFVQNNTILDSFPSSIVDREKYSVVPDIGQLEFTLNDFLDNGAEDIKIQIKGKDQEGKEISTTLTVPVSVKLIYARSPADMKPDKINKGDLTWVGNRLTVSSSVWDIKDPKIEDSTLTGDLYYSTVKCISHNILEISDPFTINEITTLKQDTEVELLFRVHNSVDGISPTFNFDDEEWEPLDDQDLTIAMDSDTYLLARWANDTDDLNEPKYFYSNYFRLITDQNNIPRTMNMNTEQVFVKLLYNRGSIQQEELNQRTDSVLDEADTDWKEEIPEANSKVLYATIEQKVGDELNGYTYYYSPIFKIITKKIDFNIPTYKIQTKEYFKEVDEIKVENLLEIESSSLLNSSLRCSTLPIPLTTLVSEVHSAIEQALYQNNDLLEVRNASGLIAELIDYGATLTGSQAEIDKAFREKFIERVQALGVSEQRENLPVNIDLGIRGVEDFVITDWFTLEGTWAPFEVIDFRLLIWHVYRKGVPV